MSEQDILKSSPLGKSSTTAASYSPELLFAIPRKAAREGLGLASGALPFQGVDLWNLYELSWLDAQGKPQVAMGQLSVPCDSASLVESKSLKLYLNSFNQSRLASREAVAATIRADLANCLGTQVGVRLYGLREATFVAASEPPGDSLDGLDIQVEHFTPEPGLLTLDSGSTVVEHLYTDLFRSNCPVTGQPDWASVAIAYRGLPLQRDGLLKYLLSFRQHGGFHEQCVEQIFVDLMARCRPESLTVTAQFLRRGGIDINPVRSTETRWPDLDRLVRQ